MDESRELIDLDDDEDKTEYYKYCFCLKSLYEIRELSCKYVVCGTLFVPYLLIADVVGFVPQFLINNVKLCLQ